VFFKVWGEKMQKICKIPMCLLFHGPDTIIWGKMFSVVKIVQHF